MHTFTKRQIANTGQEMNTSRFGAEMHLLSSEVATLKNDKSWK